MYFRCQAIQSPLIPNPYTIGQTPCVWGPADSSREMVALIPRRNSLAVSGTPVKTDIRDLLGVLRFLRVPIIPHSPRLWYRLQQPAFRPAFSGLIQSLSIRTTKAQVSPELLIPRQNRWVIPIELNQVEQHYYLDTLSRQRDIIRRSAAASSSGGALDRALLRSCLLDLRQICTHIQVGMMLHAGGGAAGGPRDGGVRMHLGKELMTMQEALAKMKRDHTAEFMVESRNQVSFTSCRLTPRLTSTSGWRFRRTLPESAEY